MPRILLTILFLCVPGLSSADSPPRIVTDIAPVHSLVAQVTQGVSTPELLLHRAADPHNAALRPSEARRLAQADLLIWIGPDLTPWLLDAASALAPDTARLTLADVPGLTRLQARPPEGFAQVPVGAHEGEDHDSEDHEGEADHAAHEHSHTGLDPHIWLDPVNATAIVRATAAALAKIDPANAARYAANADLAEQRLGVLTAEIDALLAPAKDVPFVVDHDAFQYFEVRFGLNAVAALRDSAAKTAGAARLRAVETQVEATGAHCIFRSAADARGLPDQLAAESGLRLAALDELGVGITPGPDHYEAMLRAMAAEARACLID